MKKKKKTGGIVAGLLFLIIGIIMLWWNEASYAKAEEGLKEAKKSYIDITSEKIENRNEGKLVATKGAITLPETLLTDTTFNVSVNSAILIRKVEMYQWEEDCDTDSDGYETCTYSKVWDDELISSTGFESGHTNPTEMPYESHTFINNNVKVGEFTLTESLIRQLNTDIEYTNLTQEKATELGLQIVNNKYTNVVNETPKIGDIRISFEFEDSSDASVLAAQSGKSFMSYTTKSGYRINYLTEGSYDGAAMIEMLNDREVLLNWIIRIVGALLIIVSINSLIEPLQRVANYIPIFGTIFGWVSGFVASIVGLVISLFVIAIAWFRYRPILSLCLIGGGVIIFVICKKIFNKKQNTSQITSA